MRRPTRTRRTKTGFKTKKEAEHWAAENTLHVNEGSWINPTSGKITIAQLGERWLNNCPHIKPSTRAYGEAASKNHLKPYWGHRTVASIQHNEIQT